MATTRKALRSTPDLQQFVLPNVRTTGKKLGAGSYGSVEELDVNGLICAGKKIHNTLIEEGWQGVQNIARKYVEECRLMSSMRHPHVVQFMGVCFLPDSSLPVLIMERLLTSLDDLLENTPDIPLVLKRSILADICKGLVYLHNRNSPIIHRDLSAKNVLLDSNMMAKISDLGNARIVEFQQAQTLSRNPGTNIYMPPEALYGPPGSDPTKSRYGTRIDIFSLGHMALFAVTQVFPKDLLPPNYPDTKNPGRLVGRSEIERREEYIIQLHQKLGKNHSLVKLIEQCLENDPARRPTASQALQQLEGMRGLITDPYVHLNKVEMMRLLRSLHTEVQQLQVDNSAKDTALASVKAELERSKAHTDRLLKQNRVLQSDNSAKDRQLASIQAKLKAIEKKEIQPKDGVGQLPMNRCDSMASRSGSPPKSPGRKEERKTRVIRDDILSILREIRVEPGQALRQVEPAPIIYEKAKEFAKWAPNITGKKVLYRFKMNFVYGLLIEDAWTRGVSLGDVKSHGVIEGWQNACKALLRCALILHLAPKRPEIRRMKLSGWFYVYQVSKKLNHAERILVAMGYKKVNTSREVQELQYEGDVKTSQVLETAADLVILHSELELVKELVDQVIESSRHYPQFVRITLEDILRLRAEDELKYNDVWSALVGPVSTPYNQPPRDQQFECQGQQHLSTDPQTEGRLSFQGPHFIDRAGVSEHRRESAPVIGTPPIVPPIARDYHHSPLIPRVGGQPPRVKHHLSIDPQTESRLSFQSPHFIDTDHPQMQHQEMQAYTQIPENPDHPHLNCQLSIGSTVQVSDPPRYGVIRWIGELPGVDGMVAGVELEEDLDGCTDGTWPQTGRRHFECPHGRGFFCPLGNLKPDQRFTVPGAVPGSAVMKNPLDDVPYSEEADQHIEDHQFMRYLGEGRGIQGHQNSCYLDATVFGLFALSDVFDNMFLKEPDSPAGEEVSTLLWKGIVNPLRKNGVVRHESVMSMRNKLEELGKMKGVNLDEKDPEEFLNMLFKHTFDVDPFISIKHPFGVEEEFFLQLFMEFDEELKLPKVGDVLVKMFKEQYISFTRVPSKLMIQVPKQLFKGIIPDLTLDVTTLTASPYQCTTCGESAWCICSACIAEFKSREPEDPHHVYFCDDCNKEVHSACDRSNHQVDRAIPNEGNVTQLELLSVICIETSHYVCFALKDERWLFFDSMANRVYDTYNIPKGVDCTLELNEWVYRGDHQRLLTTSPRQIPEYVRRFTQDVYMCVYIQPDVGMYEDD